MGELIIVKRSGSPKSGIHCQDGDIAMHDLDIRNDKIEPPAASRQPPAASRRRRGNQARINVLLPNKLSIRSTASSAVWLRTSSAGFSSITSKLARRPVSAIISMHSWASR